MVDVTVLDEVYAFALNTFVNRGYGPHSTELAAVFRVSRPEGPDPLGPLSRHGMAAWFAPAAHARNGARSAYHRHGEGS